MNHSQLTPEQQAHLYQRQLAQNQMASQNPALAAQMRQQQAYLQQQQRMAMQQGGFQQNQHLQPHFQQQQQQPQPQQQPQQLQQQRRPSPMGQMPQGQGQGQGQAHMGHPSQQNPMVGFGGMPPPSSGPMGVTMQPGMHPQQQQAYQQQMMRNNNAQFPVGMNPQMASVSPHPQGTPSRPPSQMQGTPASMPGGGTPTNMAQGNNMMPVHPSQQPPQGTQNNQMMQQQKSPMGPPSQNGGIADDKSGQRVDTLLEINNIFLKLALDLQSQGKSHITGGQQSPTTSGPNENGTQSPSTANPGQIKLTQPMVFITRPLQANIGYLTGVQGRRPRWPHIMDIPNAFPPGTNVPEETLKQLQELYAKLRSLFPEYNPAIDPMTGQPKAAQGQMRPPQQVQHQARASMDKQGSPVAAAGS